MIKLTTCASTAKPTKKWSTKDELECIELRSKNLTYKKIAEILNKTESSIKHKIRRIQQQNNDDRYKHTKEKTSTILKHLKGSRLKILETNAGYGGLTELYSGFGFVESYDIDKKRIEFINNLGNKNIQAIAGDSEKEIIRLLCNKCIYDVVDLDPYGMPSRYFPYVFGLINDGLLFITLPMIGVAQMNKITIRHLEAFWGVDYKDKENYIKNVISRLEDYAFMHKREINVLSVDKIDRIYRISLRVKKRSLCDIVGLKVNR